MEENLSAKSVQELLEMEGKAEREIFLDQTNGSDKLRKDSRLLSKEDDAYNTLLKAIDDHGGWRSLIFKSGGEIDSTVLPPSFEIIS